VNADLRGPEPPGDGQGAAEADPAARSPNRLIGESSPYLLQHAFNPVQWYPWGPEALLRAREEDRPIFLSIGYSACHWCHVMERESFEDPEIASFLNEHYVPIKVDREERPDLDDLYMSAVQLLSGQGGWPMSVWLTPERRPFFGGTYFPPRDRYGRPGFLNMLRRLHEVYQTRRDEVEAGSGQVVQRIASLAELGPGVSVLSPSTLRNAAEAMLRGFDSVHGGFGSAPKFPTSMGIQLLLRHYERTGDLAALRAAIVTLDAMASGGIHDHLGGGFHRYSTDDRWLVPHFEKMLYDQALLVLPYLEAFQITGTESYAETVRGTLDFVLREMTSLEGGFYSTQDADSDGVEGKYYVWTREEVISLLGQKEGEVFCRAYDVDEVGNFEGQSIIHAVANPVALASWTDRSPEDVCDSLRRSRLVLLAARAGRVPPFRDEKILTSWNGLMISGFARSATVLDEPRYLDAAEKAAQCVLSRLTVDGRLHRVYTDGRARVPAYLDDYTHFMAGLVDLHQASLNSDWLRQAERLSGIMLQEFGDETEPGFFYTAEAHSDVIVRMKNAQDGSHPSGNSMAAVVLLRLGRLIDRPDLEEKATAILRAYQPLMDRAPGAFHQMLLALDLFLGPRREIVVVGPEADERRRELLRVVRRRFQPRSVVLGSGGEAAPAGGPPAWPPLLQGKSLVESRPAVYVCRDGACGLPVTSTDDLTRALD
jgi:uncharacterized protein